MKRIVLIISLIACAGFFNVARGQTPVDPEKARNIRRLMVITGTHNLTHQLIDQMMATLKKEMPVDKPELNDKIFNIYREEFHNAFTAERMDAYVIPIYDKHFTGDELIALIAFYESSLGKKMVSAMPQIFAEVMAVGQQIQAEVDARVSQRIAAEVSPDLKRAPNSRPAAKRRPARRSRT